MLLVFYDLFLEFLLGQIFFVEVILQISNFNTPISNWIDIDSVDCLDEKNDEQ